MPHGSTAFVRNTRENLDLIDQLSGCGYGYDAPLLLRNELAIISFYLPKDTPGEHSIKFDDLKKWAGDSWTEISRMKIISKSGQTVTGTLGVGQDSVVKKADDQRILSAPTLAPDRKGSSAMFETVVGPDGWTIDARVSFRFRGTVAKTEPPLELTFDGHTTLWDGYPQVLQIFETGPGRPTYALILRVTLAMPSSWPMHEKLRTSP